MNESSGPKCPACGMDLGSNKDCAECLRYMIKVGSKDIDEKEAKSILERAGEWIKTKGKRAPKILFNQVKLLAEMLRDYFKGDYREVPWEVIVAVSFAIFYALNPFDLVPDFIPVLGYIDDTTVVGLVIASVLSHLKKYCEFKGYNPEDYGFHPFGR